ncbi:hypothetical protein [Sinorhizobium arboris]|uniref:hypothetical protein n=1 Tax=Sinorhizobium arboris TaxID=76745 RepID=UPI0003F89DE9|nr:hypothetical protein [Sinorhizobium arboris]
MAALAFLALTVIPLIGSAVHVFGNVSPYSYVETSQDESRDEGFTSEAGYKGCGHGHCQATHGLLHAATQAARPFSTYLQPDSDATAAHTPDGLMRPPKA